MDVCILFHFLHTPIAFCCFVGIHCIDVLSPFHSHRQLFTHFLMSDFLSHSVCIFCKYMYGISDCILLRDFIIVRFVSKQIKHFLKSVGTCSSLAQCYTPLEEKNPITLSRRCHVYIFYIFIFPLSCSLQLCRVFAHVSVASDSSSSILPFV